MAEYQSDILRKLQLTELQIYKDFAAFCEKNGLCHMMLDGTLLGAVRHEGFIPWDDDMDIMMPRQDYERFLQLAPLQLAEKYDVLSLDATAGYVLTFAKMCAKNTTFVEATDTGRRYHSGIFIDIVPFDETSAELTLREKQIKKTFLLARLIVLSEYPYPKVSEGTNAFLKKVMHLGCGLIHVMLKLFKINKHKLYRRWLKEATRYEGGGWYMNITDYRTHDTMQQKNVYFPPTQLSFEGLQVPVFNDAATYLKGYYGDYMTLPPKESQHNHMPSVLKFDE